jgi:hypothetical protein
MRTRQTVLVTAAALLLAACASTPKPVALPPPVPEPLDASYDWHVLLSAPFGTLLKDIPLPVHEVLLFRESAPGAAAQDEGECYAVNGTAPRFILRTPEVYLLCFKRDRLFRIKATVRVPEADGAKTYADACGLWMKHAAPSNAGICEGTDGKLSFSGHLEEDAEDDDALISIVIDANDG